MTTTANLGIALLETAQAQKEITINEAFARIDAVLNSGAIDKDLATPPGSPASGDVYIVASSPTGAWAGKAGYLAYYDQSWRFIAPKEGLMVWVNDENSHYVYNGTVWAAVSYGGGGSGDMVSTTYDAAHINQQVVGTTATQTVSNKTLTAPVIATSLSGVVPLVAEGRLTLTSNTPVTSSDVTAATSIYYTPYKGTHIALYDTTSSKWQLFPFSQITIGVPATADTNYDVFIYNNSGTPAAQTVAWTNDTTRATGLTFQNGVYAKNGDVGKRYVGTFRTTSTSGQVEDSQEKRYVWNYYNRVARALMRMESAVSWTYATATVRIANNNAANRVAIVVGALEDIVPLSLYSNVTNSTATARGVVGGIGINSTSAFSSPIGSLSFVYALSGQTPSVLANISSLPPSVGYTYYSWLEKGAGTDTQTWFGNGSYGLTGHIYG